MRASSTSQKGPLPEWFSDVLTNLLQPSSRKLGASDVRMLVSFALEGAVDGNLTGEHLKTAGCVVATAVSSYRRVPTLVGTVFEEVGAFLTDNIQEEEDPFVYESSVFVEHFLDGFLDFEPLAGESGPLSELMRWLEGQGDIHHFSKLLASRAYHFSAYESGLDEENAFWCGASMLQLVKHLSRWADGSMDRAGRLLYESTLVRGGPSGEEAVEFVPISVWPSGRHAQRRAKMMMDAFRRAARADGSLPRPAMGDPR